MVSAEVLSVKVLVLVLVVVVVCGSGGGGGGGGVQALPQVALAPVRVLCKAHFKVRLQ